MKPKLPSSLEIVKKKIRTDVDSYIFSLKLYGSIKVSLKDQFIKIYVEKDFPKKNGGKKRPDLFLITRTGNVIADHKYITSSDPITLQQHLNDLGEYQTDYVMGSQTVQPEVILLCPLEAAREYANQGINSVFPILGYVLDREITIEQVIGQVKDPSFRSMFHPRLAFPVPVEALKYKFIREEPSLPYTAQTVYASLWPLRDDFESPEFKVSYKIVLDQMNTLFPSWLGEDIHQITPGRLNNALSFLNRIGWIRWKQDTDPIHVSVSKGRRIPDSLDRFIDEFASESLRVGRTPRASKVGKIRVEEAPKETLDRYL